MLSTLNKIDSETREVLVLATVATVLIVVLTGVFWLAQNWNKQANPSLREETPAYATHGGGHGEEHGADHGSEAAPAHGAEAPAHGAEAPAH
jgi:ABC-type nickel/cobalt efflux system permease component RcnA